MGKERKMEKLILLPESERLYIRVVTLAEWENQFKKKKKRKQKKEPITFLSLVWMY